MKPSPPRQCLFCPHRADSREHIIAEWLTKRMQVRDRVFQPARFIESHGIKTFPRMTAKNFKTRQVCESCNTGWMNLLEEWFQKRLGFLVEPEWPRLADEMLKVLRGEADQLVRWMIKTAVIFERATPKGQTQAVPDGVRTMAKNGEPTGDFHLCIGHMIRSGFHSHLKKGFPVWNGGKFHPYQHHEDGFDFAICLNHLGIRLIRCPEAFPGIKAKCVISDGRRVVPFWVKPRHEYDIPIAHTFPDFPGFVDVVEVHTDGRVNRTTPANAGIIFSFHVENT